MSTSAMDSESDEPQVFTFLVYSGGEKHYVLASAYRVREVDGLLTFYVGIEQVHVFRAWEHFFRLHSGSSDHLVC